MLDVGVTLLEESTSTTSPLSTMPVDKAFSIACLVIASDVVFSSPKTAVTPQVRQSFLATNSDVTTAIIGQFGL